MGASGAGKSTLLNTLTFRHSEGLKISGSRLANNRLLSPASLTAISGYVQQEDLFIPSITVREHLLFQARLRLEASLTSGEKEVLGQVGLSRLSFAAELLSNPRPCCPVTSQPATWTPSWRPT